jgi:hypothetical protein
LGFSNASDDTTRIVQGHKYRLCLVAGMQPSRSGVILSDRNGGTPQRFIYMPTVDPETPNTEPDEPPVWHWTRPHFEPGGGGPFSPTTLVLPPHVKEAVKAGRREGARGKTPPVDSHSMLTREKVAAGLAILDGRTVVNDDDWGLSGVIMTVSDRTRAMCAQALKEESKKENVGKALQEAERTVIVTERMDEAAIQKVSGRIKTRLRMDGGPMPHSALRTSLAPADRNHFEPAITALMRVGEVVREKDEYRGRERIRYRLS